MLLEGTPRGKMGGLDKELSNEDAPKPSKTPKTLIGGEA